MSWAIYFILIFCLVYWLETSASVLPNSLILKKVKAEDLDLWLKKFNWGNRENLADPGKLPQYKFYSEIIEVLLQVARRMGGSYQDAMLFLREGLQTDRQFEKKIRDSVVGIWLQMGLMMLLTWGFIFSALHLVEVQLKSIHLLMIFGWQCAGMGLLPLLLRYFRQKYFGSIGKIWKMLFVLKSLLKVPMPRSEIMKLASVQELDHIKQPALEQIILRLKETCQKSLKMGTSYEDDVQYLMGELRFQEKWHFELFEKRLTVIKLTLLSVFFLPSYLAFIFLLLGDLMALM